MQWIILEALVALTLGLLIVWLTLSPVRKRERDEERHKAEAPRGEEQRDADAKDRR